MPCTFQTTTLPNGLRLVGEIDEQADTAACGFFVKTGTRDERPEDMGVSHFLEHMMFKGSETRSADDVNREFDEMGASYNAFTSQEMTAFWAHILPEHLPKTLDLLADIMRPALREIDFQTERGVILEEIAMYEDMPFWRLYERAMERHYREHPLSFRVLGTPQAIRNLQRDAMQAYFTQRYSADNTILALAGRFDFDEIAAEAQRRCGHWQTTNTARAYPPIALHSDEFTIEDPKVSRAYLLTISPAPPHADDRRYAADMLARLLGEEGGSLLHWALVDTGIAEEASASYDPRDGIGEFYLYASCPPKREAEVERILNETVASLLDHITENDLARLRAKTATSVTLAGERPAGRMRRLGRIWTYLNEYRTLEEELERIEAVTLDDIRAVYEAFPFQPRTVGRLRSPT